MVEVLLTPQEWAAIKRLRRLQSAVKAARQAETAGKHARKPMET